jgi:hypothetical protein
VEPIAGWRSIATNSPRFGSRSAVVPRLKLKHGYFGGILLRLRSACELDLARQQHGREIQRIPKRNEMASPGPAA